jgi:hypothetical protein
LKALPLEHFKVENAQAAQRKAPPPAAPGNIAGRTLPAGFVGKNAEVA